MKIALNSPNVQASYSLLSAIETHKLTLEALVLLLTGVIRDVVLLYVVFVCVTLLVGWTWRQVCTWFAVSQLDLDAELLLIHCWSVGLGCKVMC